MGAGCSGGCSKYNFLPVAFLVKEEVIFLNGNNQKMGMLYSFIYAKIKYMLREMI